MMRAPHRQFFGVWSRFYDLPAGCDFSAGMLRRAAARDGGIDWVRADALKLPFADESFDALTCTGRLFGEPFYWPTAGRFRRALRAAGFSTISQRPIARLPGAVL